MPIQVLPEKIRDQIAAGEVVERPASVVKELLENALDAGALNISIWIEEGGKSLIKITDDGQGMNEEDLEKSIMRHATSKITNIDDLFSIQSYGFRGEALAAIAAVSNFSITSRTLNADEALTIEVDASHQKAKQVVAGDVGTSIEVKNLFYPTPARLQYLKTNETEYRQVLKEIYGFALCHPQVSFKVYKDEKLTLDLYQAASKAERFQQITKKQASQILPISYEHSTIKITGVTSVPGEGLSHKNQQFLFVNNRRIEDHRLAFAIREAYVQTCGMEKHLQPFFAVFINIDPILVDVNVHPRKLEVKFAEPGEMFTTLKKTVMEGLRSFSEKSGTPILPPRTFTPSSSQVNSGNNFNQKISTAPRLDLSHHQRHQMFDTSPPASNAKPITHCESAEESLTVIGQVACKYIMAEGEHGIYFFDQHALHERQRFEVFWQDYKRQKITSQPLLVPAKLTFTEEEISSLTMLKVIER